MITNAILKIIYGTIRLVLLPITSLPNATLPPEILTTIQTIGGYLAPVGVVIPLATLFSVLGAFLAIEGGIFTYKALAWAYKKIPAVN